jgi:DNA-directed RNA polymerase specialized sigma24 family protein
MFGKRRVAANAESFSSKWAPVILRFFQLFVGDYELAESLAIDTLTEHMRDRAAVLGTDEGITLLRRALKNGVTAVGAATKLTDPVVQAVTSLPARQRAIVILFRGLSLDLPTVANVVDLERADVKRICLDALCEIHRHLSSGVINAGEPDNPVR